MLAALHQFEDALRPTLTGPLEANGTTIGARIGDVRFRTRSAPLPPSFFGSLRPVG